MALGVTLKRLNFNEDNHLQKEGNCQSTVQSTSQRLSTVLPGREGVLWGSLSQEVEKEGEVSTAEIHLV